MKFIGADAEPGNYCEFGYNDIRWRVMVIATHRGRKERWTGYGRNLLQAKRRAMKRDTACRDPWPLVRRWY